MYRIQCVFIYVMYRNPYSNVLRRSKEITLVGKNSTISYLLSFGTSVDVSVNFHPGYLYANVSSSKSCCNIAQQGIRKPTGRAAQINSSFFFLLDSFTTFHGWKPARLLFIHHNEHSVKINAFKINRVVNLL